MAFAQRFNLVEEAAVLDGARVLVLEDEPIIALDLTVSVEAASGRVVGPASTVAEALALLEEQETSAAILDVNLPDGELTPVAIVLLDRGIAVVIHAGTSIPDELHDLYPDVAVYRKPTPPDGLVEALSEMMDWEAVS